MELEEGEIVEYYPDNPTASQSSNFGNTASANDGLKHVELDTNLIRVLMDSYGLSPDQSSGVDEFAFELESLLHESSDLNVIKDLEGFKGENCCQSDDNESGGSLVILLNEGNDDHADSKAQDVVKETDEEILNLEEGELDKEANCLEKSPVVAAVSSPQIVRPIPIIKSAEDSSSNPILHSHLRVFYIDIDNLEEKKWRCNNVDLSDFFNYGLDEESWKDYCKQMAKQRSKRFMKNNLVTGGESRKIDDQYLASKKTAKPTFEEHKHKRTSVKTESFGEGFKATNVILPSKQAIRVSCDSAVIIEIMLDCDRENMNEGPEPLDNGLVSRTAHKNIDGDQILPFPLDGYSHSHCADHQESVKAEHVSLLKQDYEQTKRIKINHNRRTSYKDKDESYNCKQRNPTRATYRINYDVNELDSKSDSIVLVNDCVEHTKNRPNHERKLMFC